QNNCSSSHPVTSEEPPCLSRLDHKQILWAPGQMGLPQQPCWLGPAGTYVSLNAITGSVVPPHLQMFSGMVRLSIWVRPPTPLVQHPRSFDTLGSKSMSWNGCIPSIRWPTHSMRSEEHTSELQSRFDLVCG